MLPSRRASDSASSSCGSWIPRICRHPVTQRAETNNTGRACLAIIGELLAEDRRAVVADVERPLDPERDDVRPVADLRDGVGEVLAPRERLLPHLGELAAR